MTVVIRHTITHPLLRYLPPAQREGEIIFEGSKTFNIPTAFTSAGKSHETALLLLSPQYIEIQQRG